MAERKAVAQRLGDGILLITWSGLLTTDHGEPVFLPHAADKSWHVTGTPGAGGLCVPKGHNKPTSTVDLTNDPTLEDNTSAPIVGTVNLVEQILSNPAWVYPRVVAGDGTTNFEARMVCKGEQL